MGILADKRLQRPDGPDPFTLMQPLHHQENKDDHDRNLHQHKQRIEVGHQIDAFDIRRGQNRHKSHHPHPRRNFRKQRRQIDLRQ